MLACNCKRDFCLKDPDIRMDGGSSAEPDYPELDAMDYRSEYSMMNDAHGSSNVGDVNNCHTLMVIIAGLPFFFPVTNRPVRNGEELLLSYGPHYWTGNQSPESLLSATFLQMKAMLNLSFQNKRDEIGRAADVRDGTARLDKSLADERAAADVVELLQRLNLCEDLAEQRMRAKEWVVELRDRLHQEGRGQAISGALERAEKSLARGDDLAEIFAKLKNTTERLSQDYKKRTRELQAQIKRSEEARRDAEERNAQLQQHIMALNNSSQQQASRVARMEVELRGDFQRHEELCKARRFLMKMELLERHTSRCGQCGLPYVKGPLAPHGEQQHFWHCRAENHDIAELVEEGEMLAQGQGFLLQKCLNLLSRDSEVCWFLFEVLCCLAKTFARLRPKHYSRRRQWNICWEETGDVVCPPRQSQQQQPRPLQGDRQTLQPPSKLLLPVKEDEVEPGELGPSELPRGGTKERESQQMAVDGAVDAPEVHAHAHAHAHAHTHEDEHKGEYCSAAGADCCRLTAAEGESNPPPMQQPTGWPAEDGSRPSSACDCIGSSCSNSSGGRSEAQESTNHDPQGGKRVCVCGGRDAWERAAKRLRCARGPVRGRSNAVKAEPPIDLDALILEAFEEDAVAANTDWVGWVLELGALRWSFTGKTEEERRKQLQAAAVTAVFCCLSCCGVCPPEGAHTALAAIEEQRRAVDVAALERDLARRRLLLQQIEALKDRRAAAALDAAHNGNGPSDRELQTETPEECELWREIHALSEAVKLQVSVHLNAWGQQLAHFIDTRYLRLEQYERVEMAKEERHRANQRSMQDMQEVDKYMTREQKALALREKRRELRPNYLRYFALRSRVGLFDDCVARIKYFAGLEGGNMPSAVNRTLAIIAQYAHVRPSTWEREVKGIRRPEVESLLQEIENAEDADRLLGKPLFEWAMDHWPQLRKIVDIGVHRAARKAKTQLAETEKKLEASQKEANSLRQQLEDLREELQRMRQQASRMPEQQRPLREQPFPQLTQQQPPQQQTQEVRQPGPLRPARAEEEAPLPAQSAKHERGGCAAPSEPNAEQDPGTHPTVGTRRQLRCDAGGPLLLLHCDGRSAHTVVQRGDFPRIPKEVRGDAVADSEGSAATVSRFLLPPTPFVFDPPIDLNKSGCLYGFLPVGRTDHFTVDVILRLPVLTSDGFRMVSLQPNASNRGYSQHGESRQQLVSVYDPLICTRVKEEGNGGSSRPSSGNQRRRFEQGRDGPYRCALLLGARYWTTSRGNTERVQRVDLGVGTAPPSSAPYGGGGPPPPPFEQFFPFFRRDVSETTPEKEAPFIRVTLRCQREVSVRSSREGQGQLPAMRVLPFINGEPVEPMTVPRMPDFYKICSIRGMPATAKRHNLVQVVDNAVELLSVRGRRKSFLVAFVLLP
ncbi:uncharacterized protein EMH_0033240 [Eimeria mitis]|uniref:SET domain-containing protein n=1 Tax=Eimeria mitis TaxID=44415 RepID=U6K1T6_9EIME|nr:uncharacterized protein EMH_0033240 [Eimeria mitis]CDJ30901.1 hypothetical protein EMH_0033240 [Eimeria mitis]